MNQTDANVSRSAGDIEHCPEALALDAAEFACGHEPGRGPRAVEADERDRAAQAHPGESFGPVVGTHEWRPGLVHGVCGIGNVKVVIAGNDADAFGTAEGGEPVRGVVDLLRQSDVRQIAGDDPVFDFGRADAVHELLDDGAIVICRALPTPRKPAEDPLVSQCARIHVTKVGEVRIGQMGELEGAVVSRREGGELFHGMGAVPAVIERAAS